SVFSSSTVRLPPLSTLFPYTTLFRSLSVLLRNLYLYYRLIHYHHGDQAPLLLNQCLFPLHSSLIGSIQMPHQLPQYLVHPSAQRSEEHTSELQSRENLVCRLLLEKKK